MNQYMGDHSIASGGTDSGPRCLSQWTLVWLAVIPVLLPLKVITLPHNVNYVDFWVALGMAMFWTSFVFSRQSIRWTPYVYGMWLIVLGSVISTFASPDVKSSVIVVVKEVYLFAWFITLITLLSDASSRQLRTVLVAWLVTAVLHGVLIIAEFFSVELWHFVSDLASQPVKHEIYRPAGFYMSPYAGNANKAAFFQILGFVPLGLVVQTRRAVLCLGGVLFASILATGSMGATSACLLGLAVALVGMAWMSGDIAVLIRALGQLVIAVVLLSALVGLAMDDSSRAHLEGIIFDRAGKSSGGRFDLWERGLAVAFREDKPLFVGVGGENFRVVDGKGNQLHNDFLALTIERGLFGTLGLIAIAGLSVQRAIALVTRDRSRGGAAADWPADMRNLVFLATIIMVLAESLTHQVFHARELWLTLALQEVYYGHRLKERGPTREAVVSSIAPIPAAV